MDIGTLPTAEWVKLPEPTRDGYDAAMNGEDAGNNPFPRDSREFAQWFAGWGSYPL